MTTHPNVELKHFSVARDFAPTGVGTYILRARKYGKFLLQAPMDYPPDWMLYDVRKHQDIPPKYYAVLAAYFVKYLEEYRKRGIEIDYLSVFNEPEQVYTKITYPEIRILLRDFVGPALRRSGLSTKMMISEAPERLVAFRRYPVILDDPAVREFVSAVAYHGYDFAHFDQIAELKAKYPDLQFWMDELCYAYEAGYPKQSSCRSGNSPTATGGATLFSVIWRRARPRGSTGTPSSTKPAARGRYRRFMAIPTRTSSIRS